MSCFWLLKACPNCGEEASVLLIEMPIGYVTRCFRCSWEGTFKEFCMVHGVDIEAMK